MSQWTHVNGNIRFDCLGDCSYPKNPQWTAGVTEELKRLLGKIIRFDSPSDDWNAGTPLPIGSEGKHRV